MKLPAVLLVVFAIIIPYSLRADSYSESEAFSKRNAFNADARVTLKNVNGRVEIRTWDKPEILIEGEKRAHTAEELQQIDLRMEVSNDKAEIAVKLPKREGGWFGSGNIRAEVNFVVTVPVTAVLSDIRTVNGSVSVKGTRGTIHAGTTNGKVMAEDVAGQVSLSTVNGGVEARLSTFAAGDRIDTHTVNGGIKLKLPEATSAKVNASVVNGSVACDFPLQLSGSMSRRRVHGTIGSGAAEISAETVNGGVHIERL